MFKPKLKSDSFDVENMSLAELNQRLVTINQELVNLNKGFAPKHLCRLTIEKYEKQKEKIEAQIESKKTPSILSVPS